ncbi:MAG: response regulator [Nitrospirae bacterium]|nr:response regulator [Nitrospirota bacterium]
MINSNMNRRDVLVLLIDDDEDDFLLISDAVKEAGLSITLLWKSNGEEALGYLKSGARPNLIITDLNMPGMDGREVIKAIKMDDATRAIPVVALTTSDSQEDVRLCYKIGANSYLTKPSSFARLLEIVHIINVYWLKTVQLPQWQEYDDRIKDINS